MAKNDVERVTEEKIAKGGVLVRFYFDIQDKEKDKLQPLLLNLVNEQLMKEPGIVYVYGSVEEPIEKDGVFMTSAIVTALFDSFKPLMAVAFRYAPAALEILKPQKEMHFNTGELQSMLMDLSQISVAYSQFILEKVMKPEDVEQIKRQMANRAEVGKKYMTGNKEGEDGGGGKK
jgi:hypothetical protein